MRIASVLPSATEIVHALGHGEDLVGRSAECDYPLEARRLPVVMRPRTLDPERPSREIDARARAARARDESLYELDVDLLRSLRPDLLLTQDLCSVCSVTEGEVEDACARAGVRPRVLSLSPRTLAEVWRSVETIGRAIGDVRAGGALADRLRSATPPTHDGPRRRVAVVEWLDPPILAGLWTPEIVEAAGGSPVGPAAGAPGQRTTWESLSHDAIDLLLLSPCSFPVPRTLRELESSELRREVARVAPPWGTYVADEAYFSRPGPRLAHGVRLVRDLLAGEAGSPPMPVATFAAPVEGTSA